MSAAFARRWRLVAVLLLLAGGVWVFATIAEEVVDGETPAFDRRLLLALREPTDLTDPLGPAWAEEMARDVTALGGNTVLVLVALATAGYLLLVGKPREAGLLLVAVASGIALSYALKWGFERPRPDLVEHETRVYTASFPSGHAMLAAVTYLTLGVLLARVQQRQRIKVYVLAVAVLLTLAVGISRVYLGVHWPTDVLAGWAAGTAWALGVALVARQLQREGKVEGPA